VWWPSGFPYSAASRVPGGPWCTGHREGTRRQEALLEEIRGLANQTKNRCWSWPTRLRLTHALGRQATSQIEAVADTVATIEGRLVAMLSRIEALEARLDRPEHPS